MFIGMIHLVAASGKLRFNRGMAKRLSLRSTSKKTQATNGSGAAAKLPTVKQSGLILAASIALFAVALVVWYQSYYTRPSVVLWGAIDKALNTPGIAKQVIRGSDADSVEIYSLNRYEGEQGVHLQTVVSQQVAPQEEGGEPLGIQATTESLGISDGDYQRYVTVTGPGVSEEQRMTFDKIIGKWVKTGESTGKPGQLYIDGLLGTIPFGNLTDSQRSTMISFARKGTDKQEPIFQVDYNSVKKESRNGRPTYTYELIINTDAYSKWYQQYFSDMGFGEFADSQYTAAVAQALGLTENTKISVSIDVLSRQIRTISRTDEAQQATATEKILAYGLVPELTAPGESLSREEFEALLSGSSGEAQ